MMEKLKNFILILFLVLFPVLITLGFLMRLNQARLISISPDWFYSMMTLHGLGLVGLVYVTSFVIMVYLAGRYVKIRTGVMTFSIILTILGVILLVINFLFGRFAPGWYFLYPIIFYPQWKIWATDVFLVALALLGVAWFVWSIAYLWSVIERYGVSKALGWHYLKGENKEEVPPIIIISTVSTIAGTVSLISGVLLLAHFLYHRFSGNPVDALLVKNLTFLFGHTLINIVMYHLVAMFYEIYPEYTRNPWKTTKPVVYAWNSAWIILLFAMGHHLYMDFAQLKTLSYLGQIASYAASVPSLAVTILATLAHTYRRNVHWNFASVLMFFGVMGWAVGGCAAVIDATIAVNFRFHNTLWVPGHFHTYLLGGVIFLIFGFILYSWKSPRVKFTSLEKIAFTLLLLGAYGHVIAFYLGGVNSIPRRYALYLTVPNGELGTSLARFGSISISVFFIGLILYLINVIRKRSESV